MDGYKFIFIGSGSAFTVGDGNFQSNMILENPKGRKLLIDCGTDVRLSLHSLGYSYLDITDIFISHLHADHCGGLEWFALSTKFDDHAEKPTLHINEYFAKRIWDNVLSGGLDTLHEEHATLDSYFNLELIKDNGSFDWSDITFQTVKTKHIHSDQTQMPSFGLCFKVNETSIFLTTDTQFHPEKFMSYYERADVIFHDCETSSTHSNVHAHYSELVGLDKSIKSKMWLYHYQPGELPDAKADGFCGFVKKGQCFTF